MTEIPCSVPPSARSLVSTPCFWRMVAVCSFGRPFPEPTRAASVCAAVLRPSREPRSTAVCGALRSRIVSL